MAEGERPQDVGRSHRRRGRPSAATTALLSRYQAAMRDELEATLGELAPRADGGLMPDAPPVRPSLVDRMRLWDLAIKLGRELGSAIDVEPVPTTADPRARARRKRVDYG